MPRGREDAVRFAQITLGPRWEGKVLGDLNLGGGEGAGLPVLALREPHGADFVFNPGPDVPLHAGSVVVTMGETSRVRQAQADER